MTQRPSTFIFQGGLDVSTSPLVMGAGRIMAGINYEAVTEGYRRMDGIERFDGRALPSSAQYWGLPFIDGRSIPAVGSTITGATSGATGTLATAPVVSTGEFALHDATGVMALTNVTGEFDEGEAIYAGGILSAVADGPSLLGYANTAEQALDFAAAAQAINRGLIGRVPGSGPVRGVAAYQGAIYAFRDNVEESAGAMWRASPTGWQPVPTGRMVAFTAALVEIFDGDRITGAISGAIATAARVVRRSGDWGTTAEGYIVLSDQTGSFVNEQIKIGGQVVGTITADVAITIPSGGSYHTIVHNFYGSRQRTALYGVNGVGKAFEFMDGVYTPLETGTAPDRPYLIFEIAEHLGLIFPGGSIQLMAPGKPITMDVVQGSAEFGFGTEITDVVQANESAVVFFGEAKIGTLSGRDVDTFQFQELTEEAGAFAGTAQRMGRTLYLDARGLRDLAATQAYGNFRAGSLLPELTPLFTAKRKAGLRPVLSYVVKTKSQYRIIWNDGSGLCVFMGRKNPEATVFSIAPLLLTCATAAEQTDGEAIYAGSEDGYVYRIDSGASLDGAGVRAYIMPPFNHLGSARQEKRSHSLVVELDGPAETRLGLSLIYDYGSDEQPQAVTPEQRVIGGGGLWDTSVWDEFYWTAPMRGYAEASLDGIGINMAPVIAADSHPAEQAHTLQAYTLNWSPRRMRR